MTEVDYNDGLSNEYQTWTYDAAGNRASDSSYSGGGTWTYDNLNRMTEGAGSTYSNDILGNRTERGTTLDYVWDDVNRLKTLDASSGTDYDYMYRADGMRIEKKNISVTVEYSYDGQMPIEEYNATTTLPRSSIKVIRYGLGARGIDFIERTTYVPATTTGYPIYDGHGNMVATLAKSTSSPYFTVSDRRAYDAWGTVRRGNTTGEPNPRFCANLGHVQDDESGLIYMRARYYEPWSGRFVSEDPAQDGDNWAIYAGNDPINMVDSNGKSWEIFKPILDMIYPLLKSFGLGGLIQEGMKFGARLLGKALVAIGLILANVGYAMSAYAKVLAESTNFFGRIAGAALGRLGAKAVAASLAIRSAGYFLEAFGDDIPFGRTVIDDSYDYLN